MFSQLQSLFLKHRRSVTEANQKARIISSVLLAIASCVFVLLLIFSFAFRSFVMRHPGIIAVFIGVAGVEFFEWQEEHSPYKTWKRWFTVVLVLGLAYEMIEASASDAELSRAIRSASEANVRSSNAEKQAGQANERAAKFDADRALIEKEAEEIRSTNFGLQAKLLEFESKTQPRAITTIAHMHLVEQLTRISKGPVCVRADWLDTEAAQYADQISQIFKESGFEIRDLKWNVLKIGSSGTWIIVKNAATAPANARPIQDIFRNEGIDLLGASSEQPGMGMGEEFSGANSNLIVIWVAFKP